MNIEQAVREALAARASEITPDSLRQRLPRGQRRRRPWPVLVSVAVVTVLLISIITVSFVREHPSSPPVGGSSVTSITGRHWRLMRVQDKDGTVDVPASLDASIEFYRDRELLANDSVNAHSGRYQLTDAGYRTGDIAVTLAGYAGHDPAVLATSKGIAAITPYRGSADTRLSGGRLIISAHGYSLTFVNAGVATPPPPGLPTSTRTGHR